MTTGNPFQWMQGLETVHWIVIGVMSATSVATVMILYRRYQLTHRAGAVILRNVDDYQWHLGEKSYEEAIWDVYGGNPDPLKNETVFVRIPPKCVKCKTKLEQSPRFVGGYRWWCVGCGFKKNNKDSFGTESDRVERLVEGQFERQRQDQLP